MKNLIREDEVHYLFWDFQWSKKAGIATKKREAFDKEVRCCALRLLASAGSKVPRLDAEVDKIPNVYWAADYVFRAGFDELNRTNRESALDEDWLVQAMFLHRGIFLRAVAQYEIAVYLPYHSRGKLLAADPPMTWEHIALDGLVRRADSLFENERPRRQRCTGN